MLSSRSGDVIIARPHSENPNRNRPRGGKAAAPMGASLGGGRRSLHHVNPHALRGIRKLNACHFALPIPDIHIITLKMLFKAGKRAATKENKHEERGRGAGSGSASGCAPFASRTAGRFTIVRPG